MADTIDRNYKLRGWMGSNRVSQVEMASRIGMPESTFKTRMNGSTQWTITDIDAILATTGLKFEEIF